MLPEAPSLFSTTIGWFQRSPSLCARSREMMSVPPPGAKPTTMRTGFAGYGCDHAAEATSASASTRRRIAVS